MDRYDERARELWVNVYHGCAGHDHGHIDVIAVALREAAAEAYRDAADVAERYRANERDSDFARETARNIRDSIMFLMSKSVLGGENK